MQKTKKTALWACVIVLACMLSYFRPYICKSRGTEGFFALPSRHEHHVPKEN